MPSRPGALLLLLTSCLCAYALRANAESALSLPFPDRFGVIPAVTYDAEGHPIGHGLLRVERRENGSVWIEAETGIDSGGENTVSAELEPVGDGSELRLVAQFSRSHDEIGDALGLLHIDHRAHQARCFPPRENGSAPEPQVLELPAQDRVANVPLNLLFLPLVRGEEKRVDFQILLCRGGPRLVDAKGTVMRREAHGTGNGDLVEIEYELDLPSALAIMARPFLPRISMWFDSQEPGSWLGHRMPLYTKGPTVLVVRSGVSLESLGITQ
jgi:hypothetical protein